MIPDRIARVEELLKREIGTIIQHELQDPRLEFVSVTKVKAARDLKNANVWISVLEAGSRTKQDAIKALTHARNRIQKFLSQKVSLRYIPHLLFKLDETIEYNANISKVINRLRKEEGREDTE